MKLRSTSALPILTLAAGLLIGACARSGSTAVAANEAAPSVSLASVGSADVVARVGGGSITLADVDEKVGAGLLPLRQQEYEMRRRALDGIIAERLIAKEAAARGISPQELLRQEVDSKVTAPTKDDVDAVFWQLRPRLGGRSREEMGPQLEKMIREQRTGDLHDALVARLKAAGGIKIQLEAPRVRFEVPDSAPHRGPAGAPVTIVQFSDYQCPYCQRAEATVERLLEAYGAKLRYVHREFPLAEQRVRNFRASRCAGEQGKYWEYHQGLLGHPGDFSDKDFKQRAAALSLDADRFAECLASDRFDSEIQAAHDQGLALGVDSTPTFFINGRLLKGARPFEQFREIVDEELERTGP
jgi:protein-disulfide isomerase